MDEQESERKEHGMAKRKALSKRTRFEVFKRDEFTCQYCGGKPPNVVLVIDHITPVASGGSNAQTNLITSCNDCNSGKSDVPLERKPEALKESLAKLAEAREQFEEYNKFIAEADKRIAIDVDYLSTHWCDCMLPDEQYGTFIVSKSRQRSIKVFLQRLPLRDVLDAMDLATMRLRCTIEDDHAAWSYFCAVCWNKINPERKAKR